MGDHTLPGDLPGLLRRGSVVVMLGECPDIDIGETGIVEWTPVSNDRVAVAWQDGARGSVARRFVALDLTDPTSRIHALWWLDGAEVSMAEVLDAAEVPAGRWATLVMRVYAGADLLADDLDTFCRVLRAAAGVVRAP